MDSVNYMISGLFNIGYMHSICSRVSGNVRCGMDQKFYKVGTKPYGVELYGE